RLLEEPQAAFYDFTARHRQDLTRVLEDVRLVLVVDVGGGTSDFTLVQVSLSSDGPALRRIAVGDHLMLGGDNMDAAVARKAEERMVASGRKLSPTQWTQLVQAARLGKEELLAEKGAGSYHLSVAGEGSRLIGSALSAELSRTESEEIVLDGFFPRCAAGDLPRRSARVALQELGLPYAQDPAITRQLAGFLCAHAHAGHPDAILLNGGVFNSSRIAARLVEVVSSWWPDARLRVLQHDSLDLAVARGAGYYGLVRRGMGRRIGGGTAHAVYIGFEAKHAETPMALCVIPRGHEEGETAELGERTFNLTLGRPVQFPLYTATSERVERSGEIVPVSEDMHPLPPIHTLLKSAEDQTLQAPVHLRATLTEIGTLELWCVSGVTGERWRLEFELRGAQSSGSPTVVESMPPRFAEARKAMERVYGRAAPVGQVPTHAKQIWRALEQIIGPREQWRLP